MYSLRMFFEALQFTPRLKAVLARVLPILGNVRDVNRPVLANGMIIFFCISLQVYNSLAVLCFFVICTIGSYFTLLYSY